MKTVAITGVTGTLGSAVARTFNTVRFGALSSTHDWQIHGCGRSSLDKYGKVKYTEVDVTSYRNVQYWFHEMGTVDALVTCAGVSDVASFLEQDWIDWRYVIEVNLTGTRHCIQEAVRCGATRIVTVASIHGGTPTSYPNRAAYTASKAGVVGLTRALAVELAPRGIAINAVAPGHLPVLMPGTSSGQELLDAAAARTPAGWLATPEEVADVVYWLCSDAPVTMTGQVLVVDGGFTLSSWPL